MVGNDYRRIKADILLNVRIFAENDYFDIAVPDTNTVMEILQYMPNGTKWQVLDKEFSQVVYEKQ